MSLSNTRRKIILAGGSGFLGTALARALLAVQPATDVLILTRNPGSEPRVPGTRELPWDGRTLNGAWPAELDGAAAVVNLAGRSVDCRHTPANLKLILDSRVDSVTALAAAIARCARPPAVWVQSGTAHIFGDSDTATFTDDSPPADPAAGMAPKVGHAWETAFFSADTPRTRKVNLRISFVLGPGGGALKTLAGLARLGLGGAVGSGRQPVSWIHIADMVRIFQTAIDDPTFTGSYIASAPEPLSNAEFMRLLRRAVHRPWSPRVPVWAVRMGSVFLATDPDLALGGRRVIPTRLMQARFPFQFPSLAQALADLLSPNPASRGLGETVSTANSAGKPK